MSRLRSSTRSRHAQNTFSIAGSLSVASVCEWSGVSMMTSCAPMPFIRSNSPSPSRSSVPSTRSAGNLLGTTRTSHPPVLPGVPLRYARISGGVWSSCPSQNGQSASGLIVTVSIWKSLGRFCRSVAMMTQRPVTGSFLRSAMNYRWRDSKSNAPLTNSTVWPLRCSSTATTSKRHATPVSRLMNKYDSAIALRRCRFCHVTDSNGDPKRLPDRALHLDEHEHRRRRARRCRARRSACETAGPQWHTRAAPALRTRNLRHACPTTAADPCAA